MNTPSIFVGKEPNLSKLKEIIDLHPDKFSDIDLSVIEYYYADLDNKYINSTNIIIGSLLFIYPKYYLGGQLLISVQEPITNDIIEKVKEMNIKSNAFGFANSFEANSSFGHELRFENIQKIIKRFYEISQ